jgi:tRNA (guanine-N7-)-methyltransferase
VCDADPRLQGGEIPRPDWRPVTKFEERARLEGRDVHDLLYRRDFDG